MRPKLPSFMRIKYLKKCYVDGTLHLIKNNNDKVVGFFELDGEKFKNLFIHPSYRRQGIASMIIKEIMGKQIITIATTHRTCNIKKLIKKLGFTNTGKVVEGKQSELEVWMSPANKVTLS